MELIPIVLESGTAESTFPGGSYIVVENDDKHELILIIDWLAAELTCGNLVDIDVFWLTSKSITTNLPFLSELDEFLKEKNMKVQVTIVSQKTEVVEVEVDHNVDLNSLSADDLLVMFNSSKAKAVYEDEERNISAKEVEDEN